MLLQKHNRLPERESYISLVTTHYDNVSSDGRTRNMQVRGLKDVNFINLEEGDPLCQPAGEGSK